MSSIRDAVAQIRRWALPYFWSEHRWAARGLLAAIVAIELASVGITVLLNSWNGRFYNALQHRDGSAFARELGVFSLLAAAFILMAAYQLYLSQRLQIRWREWMTERFLSAWLKESLPYRLQLSGSAPDNPDQRIAEDIKLFVASTLSLSIGLLGAVVTLASFSVILWALSSTAPPVVFGHVLPIPGYLLWIALVYAMLGTVCTHWIGRRLVTLNMDQQRFEADFRTAALRVRENAEQVALLKGERAEHARLRSRFDAVSANWIAIVSQQKRLTFFTAGYSQTQTIIPFLAAGSAYFSSAIELGVLMQTASAFGRVQGSLSYFVHAYPQLAEWRAVVERLDGFERSIVRTEAERPAHTICQAGSHITVGSDRLVLRKPDSTPLLTLEKLLLAQSKDVLLTGPSGTGKSTLLRAIAGIWPHVDGKIELPTDAKVLVLPQRPYLPDGTLRDAIAYPDRISQDSDSRIARLLCEVGLVALADRLSENAHWQTRLSLGEQQRLTLVRAVLLGPDWLLLDEATASLDEVSERSAYELLRAHLPSTTIISVGHRSTLKSYHAQTIEIGHEPEPDLRAGSRPRALAAAEA